METKGLPTDEQVYDWIERHGGELAYPPLYKVSSKASGYGRPVNRYLLTMLAHYRGHPVSEVWVYLFGGETRAVYKDAFGRLIHNSRVKNIEE